MARFYETSDPSVAQADAAGPSRAPATPGSANRIRRTRVPRELHPSPRVVPAAESYLRRALEALISDGICSLAWIRANPDRIDREI